MAHEVRVPYADRVSIQQPPTPRLAHEGAILDNWKEDDSVYLTLHASAVPAPESVTADAAVGPADSPELPASLPLPMRR
jgi:hypothetical protein